jgi:hypothetical protein
MTADVPELNEDVSNEVPQNVIHHPMIENTTIHQKMIEDENNNTTDNDHEGTRCENH